MNSNCHCSSLYFFFFEKGGNQTRWMSNRDAVVVLRKTLPAVLMDLGELATKDPVALGLARFMEQFDFVANVILLMNVHERLGEGFECLQKRDLFWDSAKRKV